MPTFPFYEALKHAGYANGVEVETVAIDSGKVDADNVSELMRGYDGIVVPGWFSGKAHRRHPCCD